MKLSPHVSLMEFEHSDTAITYGIPNKMNNTETQKAIDLCMNVFEPIRTHLGKPIKINSGFRSLAVNKRLGGAKNSQHCFGEAMDLDIQDKEVFDWIKDNVNFDQLIYEHGTDHAPQWIHVSFRKGRNRNQVLRAIKQAGKTKYVAYE